MIKKLLSYLFDRFISLEPYEDAINKSVDGTPLTILSTPKPFSGDKWYIRTSEAGLRGATLRFGIERDIGKYLQQTIDALEGKYNNLFTREDLNRIALIADKVVKQRKYRAFKHNGKAHMEFVEYSLDPRDITKLRQAVQNYNFNLL